MGGKWKIGHYFGMIYTKCITRYATEFRQTRQFFASGQWGRNKTLVVFSERTFVPFLMGEGDFIVGNRKVSYLSIIKVTHR